MAPHTPRLFDARQYTDWDEDEGGRWVTFCETHGQFLQHSTRRLAREWLPYPEDWCNGGEEARDGS